MSTGSVVAVDLGGGVIGAWAGTTTGIAFGALPFLLVLALAAEAWGKPPGQPRDFGGIVSRFFIVLVLLTFYGELFGRLASLVDSIADRVAPQETWTRLGEATERFLSAKAKYQARETNAAVSSGSLTNIASELVVGKVDELGGMLVDAAVTLIILCGQAAFRIIGTLGGVLAGLLYVLGPLAIAASVPRGSDAGTRWLRVFVSVLMWPLISALLVGLLTSFALKALEPNAAYEAAYASIVLAGVLTVTAFAVPVVASALTGAGMGAVSAGWSSMNAWSGAAITSATAPGALAAAGASREFARGSAAGAASTMGAQSRSGSIQSAAIVGLQPPPAPADA
ncbi:MAG: hypothetical protein QM817_40710 [Archangium sp.]